MAGKWEQSELSGVEVRLVRRKEVGAWKQAMSEQHYLGFRGIVGESLKYVATVGDEWVGLLAWGAAALKVESRDRWIGWDACMRRERLRYVVNNVRFLLLRGWNIRNLASRVLAANCRRLSNDWEVFYNHPVLLAETFVDISRFVGTCYKAAGWDEVGLTLGFTRKRSGYTYNGQPKKVLVRPLCRDAAKLLTAPFLSPYIMHGRAWRMNKQRVPILDVNRLPLEGKGGLIEVLESITEPRKARGVRHSLSTILCIAVCACLSGARNFRAIGQWAENIRADQMKIFRIRGWRRPSESAIRRTLHRVNAQEVDKVVGKWLFEQRLLRGGSVGLDGKTLRGSHDGKEEPVQLLAAVLNEEGIVIAQCEIDSKTNEIPMVPTLLEGIDVRGAVITADALHTQAKTAKYIVEEKKADFVFTVKENQPTLYKDIADLRMEAIPPSAHNS